MKNLRYLLIVAYIFVSIGISPQVESEEEKLIGKPVEFTDGALWIYVDFKDLRNHCWPGRMGDYNDILVTYTSKESPHSGETCIKVTYKAESSSNYGWGGVCWHTTSPRGWYDPKHPHPEGYDLRGAKTLKFWARGEKGGERINECKVGLNKWKVGTMQIEWDSDSVNIGPIDLTSTWQEYEINLEGRDLTSIDGGFILIVDRVSNPNGCVFYLDDIMYMADEE